MLAALFGLPRHILATRSRVASQIPSELYFGIGSVVAVVGLATTYDLEWLALNTRRCTLGKGKLAF